MTAPFCATADAHQVPFSCNVGLWITNVDHLFASRAMYVQHSYAIFLPEDLFLGGPVVLLLSISAKTRESLDPSQKWFVSGHGLS
ncbi:MAG TPA: hypothetical protein VG759_22805 [Candidatus Angelobacter sp.]|jgi:hypothetical protein|nr:hypothetical protein [Candidatus Angelobacter sp.]